MPTSILFLLTIVVSIFLTANSVYALGPCPESTAYTEVKRNDQWTAGSIIDTDRIARFWINVGNNKNYDSYKMLFNCGLKFETDTSKDSDGVYIFKELNKSDTRLGTPCEFDVGTHEVIVKNPAGTDQCSATYTVLNADSQCQLTIKDSDNLSIPEKDIAVDSRSNLTVSGKNLSGRKFGLLMNNDILKGSHEADFIVNTEFTGIKIPNNLLTPGQHIISLRRPIPKGPIHNPLDDFFRNYYWGPPLCPRIFTVGTPEKPGKVTPGETEITKGCTEEDIKQGKCTSAGGKEAPGCTNNTGNPGIATAIGCIHTNPPELVKDFMTFAIGIGGGLAFLMMLLGAFQMLTSAGNPETLATGRSRITSAIIGLLFVIFAILLLKIIGVDILNLPGFK